MNQIYGRFQQKHDTEANWLKATNFAPLEGELIVYDADENYNYPRFKVGIWDGESEKTEDMLVSNLPFSTSKQVVESGLGENSIQQVGTGVVARGDKTLAIGNGSNDFNILYPNTLSDDEIIAAWDTAHEQVVKPGGLDPDEAGMFSVALGNNSQVFGQDCLANLAGQAFGRRTKAIGKRSHSEGTDTAATGNNSHVEGQDSIAKAVAAHAEGYGTVAGTHGNTGGGEGAHSEGTYTKALATASHAEGTSTEARATASHTEGAGTIATQNYQHVQGKYNYLDENGDAGNYAHIIGGGINASNRQNIHTVDWNGNAWYKGSVDAKGAKFSAPIEATSVKLSGPIEATSATLSGSIEAGNGKFQEVSGTKGTFSNDVLAGSVSLQYVNKKIAATYADPSKGNESGAKMLGASSTSRYGLACGYRCQANGAHAMAIGAGLIAKSTQVVVGLYNKEESGAAFIVGAGASEAESDRKNVFVVKTNGTGYLGNKKILVEGDVTNSGEVSGDITVNTIAIGDIGQTTIGAFTASFAGDVAILGTVKPAEILIENSAVMPARANIYTGNESGHVSLSNSVWGTGFTVDGYGTACFGTDEDYGSGVTIYGFGGQIEADNSITASNYITASAGITEMYEWTDGNTNDEDRRGLFITLDGDKIRVANENDNYILGVIDPNPSLIGDAAGLEWKDKYLKDVFGSYIYEEVEVPATYDKEGNVLAEATTRRQKVLNPEYDEMQEYVSRTDRKEFAAITSKGKVVMIDDGTCIINGYATVGANGQATYSSNNYAVRVLERIDDTHIKVLIDSVFVK